MPLGGVVPLEPHLDTGDVSTAPATNDAHSVQRHSSAAMERLASLLTQAESDTSIDLNTSTRAGLWLLAGDLERSHEISQADSSATGSFWHGIMHRREGDFSNAAYWFRRAGSHPVFDELASTLGNEYRDAFAFNDRVEKAIQHGDESRCREIQWIEWQLLMQYGLHK